MFYLVPDDGNCVEAKNEVEDCDRSQSVREHVCFVLTLMVSAVGKLVKLDPSRYVEAESMSKTWTNNATMFVGMLQPGVDTSLQNEAIKIVHSLALAGGKIRPSCLLADVEHTCGRRVLRLVGFVKGHLQSRIRDDVNDQVMLCALETLLALSRQSVKFAQSLCAAGFVPLTLYIVLEEGVSSGNWQSERALLVVELLLVLVKATSSTTSVIQQICAVLAPCFLEAPIEQNDAIEFVNFCKQNHSGWDKSVRTKRRDTLRECFESGSELVKGSNGHGCSWTLEAIKSDDIDVWDGKRKLFTFSG